MTLDATVIALKLLAPLPQVFVGVTVIFPLVEPNVRTIEFVFVPDVIVAPVGTVHVYPIAPETDVIE